MDTSDNIEANTPKIDNEEVQKDRAFLRQKFLRFIAKISNGHKCQFNMQENIVVEAKLRAVDLDMQNIVVSDLKTPYLPVESAILRSSDIISMHFSEVPVEALS